MNRSGTIPPTIDINDIHPPNSRHLLLIIFGFHGEMVEKEVVWCRPKRIPSTMKHINFMIVPLELAWGVGFCSFLLPGFINPEVGAINGRRLFAIIEIIFSDRFFWHLKLVGALAHNKILHFVHSNNGAGALVISSGATTSLRISSVNVYHE